MKKKEITISIERFAKYCHDFIRNDNYMLMGTGGMPGKGKSTFMGKLQKAYAKVSGTNWSFDNITWERDELMKWIDGEGEEKKGQKPMYTAILPDEMLHMFHNRAFQDSDQNEAIQVFNMCRDRHLFVGGNLPVFFQLDKQLRALFNFYIYIPKRGVAWVFSPEENPFSDDPWNAKDNMKLFRANRGGAANCINYLFTVRFDDWSDEEREKYYAIRNTKRVRAMEKQSIKRTAGSPNKLKIVLGTMANNMIVMNDKLSITSLAEMSGIHHTTLGSYCEMAKSNFNFETKAIKRAKELNS